ncbi:phage stabilization protein [Caudoviricetes sp.]|nr:phage stabilization protein [Caudoviricetes sp.]
MAQPLRPATPYPPQTYGDCLGIATTGEVYKRPKYYAKKLANAELTQEGTIRTARGYEQLGTATWNDNIIREIMQYRKSGVDIFLVFGTNQAGTSGGIAAVSSQWTSALAFNEVLTLSNITNEACLLQFGDLAYLFNGTDDKFYNGSTWADIGADAPISAASLSATIPGSLEQSSDYVVAWGWYDSTYLRRTNAAPLSTSMTTGGSGATAGLRVTLPNETAPTGYDQKYICRTVAFGTQLFVDQYVAASALTCDLTQSDAVLVLNNLYEGGDDAPAAQFDIVVKANGKFYAGSSDDSTCRVRRSKVSSQYGSMPQSWPARHFTDCNPSASNKLVGMGVVGNQDNETVIVVKQKEVGKIVRLSSDIEVYQKIYDRGGSGHKSVFQMGEFCGWIDDSNVYITDGNSVKKIGGAEDGEGIKATIQGLNHAYKKKYFACHVGTDKQVRIGVVRGGESYSKMALMGHYDKLDSLGVVKWTTREPGPSSSVYPGVQFFAVRTVLDSDNNEQVIAGNSAGNGKLYQCDVGTDDNGSSIYAEWIFRPENFGDYKNEKLFSDIVVRCRTSDSSTSVTFGGQKDLRNVTTTLAQRTIGGQGFIFGTGRFGITPLTNATIQNVLVPCQERGTEMSFVIKHVATTMFELLDFTMTGLS